MTHTLEVNPKTIFPPGGFPYVSYDMGSRSTTPTRHSETSDPLGYTSLSDIVSSAFRMTSLYHYPIWSSIFTPAIDSFDPKMSIHTTQPIMTIGKI